MLTSPLTIEFRLDAAVPSAWLADLTKIWNQGLFYLGWYQHQQHVAKAIEQGANLDPSIEIKLRKNDGGWEFYQPTEIKRRIDRTKSWDKDNIEIVPIDFLIGRDQDAPDRTEPRLKPRYVPEVWLTDCPIAGTNAIDLRKPFAKKRCEWLAAGDTPAVYINDFVGLVLAPAWERYLDPKQPQFKRPHYKKPNDPVRSIPSESFRGQCQYLGGDRLKLPGLGVVTVNDLQRRLMAPIAKMVRAMAVEGSPALDRKIEKIAIAERGKLIKADGHNLAQLRKTDPDLIDSYTAKVDLAACRKQALDYFASPGAFRLVQRDGLWYLQISAELPSQVTATSKEVGIDTGTALLVDGTNGLSIKHDCYSDAEDRLSRIDRALSDQVYGSSNYNKLLAKKRKIEGELQRNRKARQAYFASQIADVNGVIKIKKIELPDTLGLPIPIPDGKGGYKANGAGKAKERNRTILDRATGQFIALVEQQCKKRGRNFERVKVESIAPPEKLLGLDSGKKSKAKTPKTIGTKRNRKYEKRVG